MTDRNEKQPPSVSISNSFAPVVGDYAHVEQHFHLHEGTWTDGVAPDPLVSKSGMITSPYRGLNAFGERDEALFFGRDSAAADVLKLMSRRLAGTGLIVVSGVSGAGKSSLLHAGVLPRLRETGLDSMPEAASWPRLVLTPGSQPLKALAARIAGPAGADANTILPGLTANPAGFALTAQQAALALPDTPAPASDRPDGTGERRVILAVDQFEQLFTQCKSEFERQAFITALHAAASPDGERQNPTAIVVIVIRSDFEAQLADYPLLAPAVQDRYLLIGMTDRQLRMAITYPAVAAGSSVDDDLVQVLLSEIRTHSRTSADSPGRTATGAGVLPLLSHALDQAWRGRTGRTLTLADYERTGGIEGAVASSAQRAYDKLTPAQQATAQQVLIRLTATSSDGVDTAARATRADLTAGKNDTQAHDVESVLEEFAAERLLTLGADSVEISHEVLLTAWPLLRDDWLAETHADRIVRTRLHNVATEWADHSRDPSYLYSGSLRQAAAETAARMNANPAQYTPLSQTEHDFLSASDHAHQGRTRRRRAVIAGLLALTLTALTAAGGAVHYAVNANQQADYASTQHAIALSRQLVADSISLDPNDPVTARQLALSAWRVYATDQARTAMTTLLVEQQQNGEIPVNSSEMAFSPDGKLLASADSDGYVRLWNPAISKPVGKPLPAARGHDASVAGVAFTHDGKLLASAGSDGYVRLWNPATGTQVGKPLKAARGQDASANGVAFSPDGKLLASAGSDGYIRLWNPATGTQVGKPLHADGGQGVGAARVAFSPDGKLLASAGNDGDVRLWNPATGTQVGKPMEADVGAQQGVTAVAFSPDSKLLASAGVHGDVQLWNPVTGRLAGKPLRVVPVLHGVVWGVAFSPGGKLLASAGSDGYVRLWNPATGTQVGKPLKAARGQDTSANGVAFSPSGKLLASAGSDGYMRLWDPATHTQIGTPRRAVQGQNVGMTAVTFSPSGELLASAGNDGYVRLWDPATDTEIGKPLKVGPGQGIGAAGVAFSPDGTLLASAGNDGYVRLWNPMTGRRAARPLLAVSDPNSTAGLTGVAFSPDGKLLASAGSDGYVRVWNPATGTQVRKPLKAARGQVGVVNQVAFSPDGKLLASAGSDGYVRLWNPATGTQVGKPLKAARGHDASANGVAFSPDGSLLASAGSDGYVRLWNPATGTQVGKPLFADGGQGVGAAGVVFSPDGKLLASADMDEYVRLWNPATRTQVGWALPVASDRATGMAAMAFSPDGSFLVEADLSGSMETWPVWLNLDPYEALCTDVGPPTKVEWKRYAPGEPKPDICADQSRKALK